MSARLYTLLLTLALTGCIEDLPLVRLDSGEPVSGILHIDNPDHNRLTIEKSNKRYEGTFNVTKSQDWEKLRDKYGPNSKHYQLIEAGLIADHVVDSAEATLTSEDGSKMMCRLVWNASMKPQGVCSEPDSSDFRIGCMQHLH